MMVGVARRGLKTAGAHRRPFALAGVAIAAIAIGWAVVPSGRWPAWALLGFMIGAGEFVRFELADGTSVALAPAYVIVLVGSLATVDAARHDDLRFLAIVIVAEMSALAARRVDALGLRAVWVRVAGSIAAYAAFAIQAHALDGGDERAVTLLSLAAAALVLTAIDISSRGPGRPGRDRVAGTIRAHRAWAGLRHNGGVRAYSAVAASGVLMGLADHGVGSQRGLGLWGVVLFSVPLLFAWYAFTRVDAVRRTTAQTIRALSIVPERANLSPPGHAERVAGLAGAIAAELDLAGPQRESLQQAALLHHLGGVCLDDLDLRGAPVEPAEVTETSARMLRETEHLREAARVLDAASLHHRGRDARLPAETRLAAQILKVASDFDDLTGGAVSGAAAIDSLYAAPGYVYDPRVLAALERVLATTAR